MWAWQLCLGPPLAVDSWQVALPGQIGKASELEDRYDYAYHMTCAFPVTHIFLPYTLVISLCSQIYFGQKSLRRYVWATLGREAGLELRHWLAGGL